MIDERTHITQSERTASRVIDGRAVVIVIDERKLHTLSPVATRIWELADGRTLAEIVEVITAEYKVERDRALADARALLEQLQTLGAIVPRGPE